MLKKHSEFDNGGEQRESKEVEALPVRLDRLKVYITEVEKHAMFSPDLVQEGNVGARFCISGERARQIQQGILKKAKAKLNGDVERPDVWHPCRKPDKAENYHQSGYKMREQ